MLQINSKAIKKLHDHIAKVKFVQRKNRIQQVNYIFPSVDQIRAVIGNHLIPGLPDQYIFQAFYLSKQTVPQENDMANYEYTYLHEWEFTEFVARLAYMKYRDSPEDTQWPLKKKISVVLTFLLKIVGENRILPPDLVDVISESDDDY